MLKDQPAVHHVEGRCRKTAEVDAADHVEAAPALPLVQVAGAGDHRARSVDAVHRLEMVGERAGDPSDATAEVQCSLTSRAWRNPPEIGEESTRVVAAGGEKSVDVPRRRAGVTWNQNRAEWIAAAERVPVGVEATQIHRARS